MASLLKMLSGRSLMKIKIVVHSIVVHHLLSLIFNSINICKFSNLISELDSERKITYK